MRLSLLLSLIILGASVFTVIAAVNSDNEASDVNIKDMARTNKADDLAPSIQRDCKAEQSAELNQEVVILKQKIDRMYQAMNQMIRFNRENNTFIIKQEVAARKSAQAQQAGYDNQAETLLRRFAAEPRDVEWANSMESEFSSALKRISDFGMKGTEMVYHECKATLCIAKFEHRKEDDTQFLAVALAMPGIERITLIPGDMQGTKHELKVYLVREGFSKAVLVN